jgi:hydrogenase maturation protease
VSAPGTAEAAVSPAGTVVIGIGNPLRGDDGVGWRLVEELEAAGPLAGCTLRRVQQLTPELAPEVAVAERVLFVDAWLAPAAVPTEVAVPALRLLGVPGIGEAGDDATGCSHHLTAGALVAMAAGLYGRRPEAAELLVPAHAFGHGEELSPATSASLPRARQLLAEWLEGR